MKPLFVSSSLVMLAVLGHGRVPVRDSADIPISPQGSQSVSIVLNGPGGRQPRLAIQDVIIVGTDPDLMASARTAVDVLQKDLEFEEEFLMIPADEARKIPPAATVTALPIDRWTQMGADFVLMASARRSGGDLPIDIRVVAITGDAPRRQMLGDAGQTFTCQVAYPRSCAHAISDRLHKELRQRDGVAQTRIAFVSDRTGASVGRALPANAKELYISDYDGFNQQPVTANRSLTHSPSWSPDGKLIAYTSYGVGAQQPPDIYVRSVYEVTPAWRPAAGAPGTSNFEPAFSPDGTQIAFVSNRDGTHQIYVVDTYGKTKPRRLSANRAWDGAPTWSPTGNQLAFTSDRAGSNVPQLFVMNADGTGQDALPPSRVDRPSWSPDGIQIAYTCGKDFPYNICTYNLHTQKISEMLVADGFTNEQPSFAPNGMHIAFKTNRWGKDQIAIMDLKNKIQIHVPDTGNSSFPSWSLPKK